MLNLDFSNVQEGFPLLPEDDYTLVITDCEVKEAANGNSQNIIVKMEVSGGDHDGHKLLQYINVQASTMWRVKQFFVALTGDEDLQEFSLDDPGELVGNTIGATVTVTEDGKYNSVDAWYSA